jgi:rare lipoprotein A (peptidoglycan hydrolase)
VQRVDHVLSRRPEAWSETAKIQRKTSIETLATPEVGRPITRAAPNVRSMTRPLTNGPRSLMRTTTDRPVFTIITRTRVPNGRGRWAKTVFVVTLFASALVFASFGSSAQAESGVASYYMSSVSLTANGERFDPQGLTAAHRLTSFVDLYREHRFLLAV